MLLRILHTAAAMEDDVNLESLERWKDPVQQMQTVQYNACTRVKHGSDVPSLFEDSLDLACNSKVRGGPTCAEELKHLLCKKKSDFSLWSKYPHRHMWPKVLHKHPAGSAPLHHFAGKETQAADNQRPPPHNSRRSLFHWSCFVWLPEHLMFMFVQCSHQVATLFNGIPGTHAVSAMHSANPALLLCPATRQAHKIRLVSLRHRKAVDPMRGIP